MTVLPYPSGRQCPRPDPSAGVEIHGIIFGRVAPQSKQRRAITAPALVVWGRFFYFWFQGDGSGHVQSLILGAVLFNAAMVLAALGVLGDLLSSQRITLQRIFERIRRVELELGVPPSHYEPGSGDEREGTGEDREAVKL